VEQEDEPFAFSLDNIVEPIILLVVLPLQKGRDQLLLVF